MIITRFQAFLAASLLSATLVAGVPGATHAAQGDCGQPASTGAIPTATDALYTLRVAVGLDTCELAICDVDASCTVSASDALRILQRVIGQSVTFDCDACGTNAAPVIAPFEIYRTYAGRPIAVQVNATDTDGDPLAYGAINRPEGCAIDPATGVLSWTPTAEQIGTYQVQVTATDDGAPALSASALLSIRVEPEDACVISDCDPTDGCSDEPVPLSSSCCDGPRDIRIPEPPAGCPEATIAFAGRNTVGFGRLQNCDGLRVIAFAQGGLNVRFHIESRCLIPDEITILDARLETSTDVVFDSRRAIRLAQRDDGYARELSQFYPVARGLSGADLEGREALLSLTLTDAVGTVVSHTVRVVLTLSELADLPNPDIDDIPSTEAGCVGCHRPLMPNGERHGIEDAHPRLPLRCTDCHGGDASATTRAEAHIDAGDGATFLRNLASDQLDAVDTAYLRFVNPGDLRVAGLTCGLIGCHSEHVENVKLSTMSTYGGHYTLPRYLAGAQGRDVEVAAVDVVDEDFDPLTAPEGAVEMIAALREPDPGADRSEVATAIDTYLPKSCPTCHLNAFGRNEAAGAYRSSGCTACHMLYADDGLSQSDDPVIDKGFPPHPAKHTLTTAIPVEQCAHCHFQGGRVGLSYRGIREGGFDAANTPEHGVTLGTPLYGHDADYYFSDEDSRNEIDETPPDLHFEAGMVCVDCHVGGDVHGDGNLYAAERYQVGIECEDCHGTVRAEIAEDPGDGEFKNSRGFILKRLQRDGLDRIMLTRAIDGVDMEVPQIKRLLDSGLNPHMNEAMGVDENDFSHTESLECYACHTSWRQNCYGCHVTVDDSGTARNETTGETTQGASSAVRDFYTTDFFALGMSRNGRLSPLCSSMSIFVSYIGENGELRYEDRVRTSSEGRKGFGWNPFHHHTTSRVPQNCDRCHPVVAGSAPDNSETLLATYGFGTGAVMVEDEEGVEHDLTQFLDLSGELISEFPHPGTGPVPADVRDRALAIEVTPQER